MKWEDVLKRTDIVGGDLETQEDDDIYRGPIKSIELKDGCIDIELEWCATMPAPGLPGFGTWQVNDATSFSVPSEVTPQALSEDRLQINVPLLGVWVILPKGGSKLDPAKVRGLKVAKPSKTPKKSKK